LKFQVSSLSSSWLAESGRDSCAGLPPGLSNLDFENNIKFVQLEKCPRFDAPPRGVDPGFQVTGFKIITGGPAPGPSPFFEASSSLIFQFLVGVGLGPAEMNTKGNSIWR
jgi:hypothetical protein